MHLAKRFSIAACVVAASMSVFASSASAQKATYVQDFETMREKFIALAGAMEADQYDWRPMEGVRSVAEVYMLIAAEAYYMPEFWGADPPEGIELNVDIFEAWTRSETEKAAVIEQLEAAFAHCAAALEALPESRMSEEIPFFGRTSSIGDAIYLLLVDMHEHLGQAIAYARTNHVVPPWSAGGS